MRSVGQGALLLLFLVVVAASIGCSSAEDKADAAKNEKILEQLKPPTGARVSSKTSEPAYESTSDISERKIGYMTDIQYELPKGTSPRSVAESYARQLRGWQRREEVVPCEQVNAGDAPMPCHDLIFDVFKKGDAEVSLSLDGFDDSPPGYELMIIQR